MELKLKVNQAIGKINPDINKVKLKIAEQMALYRQKSSVFAVKTLNTELFLVETVFRTQSSAKFLDPNHQRNFTFNGLASNHQDAFFLYFPQ